MTHDKYVVRNAHRSVARMLRSFKVRGHRTPLWVKSPVSDGVLALRMESYWKGHLDLSLFKSKGFAVSASCASKTRVEAGLVYSVVLLQDADHCKLVVTSTPALALL